MIQISTINSCKKQSRFRNPRCPSKALFICRCDGEGEEGGDVVAVVQEQGAELFTLFYSLCYLGGKWFRMTALKSTINKFPSVLTYKKWLMIHSATIIGCKPCSRHCISSEAKSQKGKYILQVVFWVALLYGNTKCLLVFDCFSCCLQIANYARLFQMNWNKWYWIPLHNFTGS